MSIQATIEDKLRALEPAFLAVENESHRHNVPPNSETHFKVTLVAARFEGLMPVKRHLFPPEEWEASGRSRPDSPDCRGGGTS